MKRLMYLFAALFLISVMPVFYAYARNDMGTAKDAEFNIMHSGKNLAGSFVEFDPAEGGDPEFLAGQTQDFVFRAESFTTDWEWASGFWLKFPDGWVVNSVIYMSGSCVQGGSLSTTFSYAVQSPANTVRITQTRQHANPSDNCIGYYMVNATVPVSAHADAHVSWYWWGDGWGAPPQFPCSDDGYTPPGQSPCDESINPQAIIPAGEVIPGIYIMPETQSSLACPGEEVEHSLTIANLSGEDHTIYMDLDIEEGYGTVIGSASFDLDDGESEDVIVTLIADSTMEPGEIFQVRVTVYTDNAKYSAEAVVINEIQLGFWLSIATEPNNGRMDNVAVAYDGLIWSVTGYHDSNSDVRYYDPETDEWTIVSGSAPPFGPNYANTGAVHGSKAFVYGDSYTDGFSGLWSYDMDENEWNNETPSGTAPAHTGIWAPAWVSDPDTGYLYMTGGADAPGGGNLTTVYVYDPDSNEWLDPLPNFTSQRAFHAAYIVNDPAKGDKMLIVAGGVNAAGNSLASVQAYDFNTDTWLAENSIIPAMPFGLWSMGYAHLEMDSDDYLWLLGGIKGDDPTTDSIYYDWQAGEWVDGGSFPSPAVFRNGAVAYEGKVYKIGGSTGGFNPTGSASAFTMCHIDAEGPDASIHASGISYSPSDPLPGDTVTITARVYNVGTEDITSGNAKFSYSLEPGVDLQSIGTEAFGLIAADDYLDITIDWVTGDEMIPTIYIITVELTDIMPEDINLNNNTAYIELALPVELAYFTAVGILNRAHIRWMTISETDNLGFNLYRLNVGSSNPHITFLPVKINETLIPGQGTTSMPHTYTFTDFGINRFFNYIYILESVSVYGETSEYRTPMMRIGQQQIIFQ